MPSCDKKVLVTGAGGFIGSHLVEFLLARGLSVRAFLRYNSSRHSGWLRETESNDRLELFFGDIRDFDSVRNAVKDCGIVFHLAALIGIPYSYLSPLAYIRTNIEGTYNILEAGRQLGTGKILITSTSETYGTAQYVPIDERHPLVGQSPYSASKIAADQMAVSYSRSFGLPVTIVRPFNTFGPRQSTRAVIPTIVSQILRRKEEIELGTTNTTRDFTYVLDTVNGFWEIANCVEASGEAFNIGMSSEISIRDVFLKIREKLGSTAALRVEEGRIRPGRSEVERLLCDNRKILARTSWRPRYTFDSGLDETIDWMKRNPAILQNHHYGV
jgi:NAD dependent epimerase/dehydratase